MIDVHDNLTTMTGFAFSFGDEFHNCDDCGCEISRGQYQRKVPRCDDCYFLAGLDVGSLHEIRNLPETPADLDQDGKKRPVCP